MTRAQLDPNLKQAIATGTPVEVFDPSTNEVYYLVSVEQYQSLTGATADHFDPRHSYPIVEGVMADDDAHDSLLGSYQTGVKH